MHPLPLPSTLASPHSAQTALDKALAALEWVMQQRPDRPTSIESVRRAATTVLNLATKLLAPPPKILPPAAKASQASVPSSLESRILDLESRNRSPLAPILAAHDTPPRALSLRQKAGAAPPRRTGPPSIIAPDSG